MSNPQMLVPIAEDDRLVALYFLAEYGYAGCPDHWNTWHISVDNLFSLLVDLLTLGDVGFGAAFGQKLRQLVVVVAIFFLWLTRWMGKVIANKVIRVAIVRAPAEHPHREFALLRSSR